MYLFNDPDDQIILNDVFWEFVRLDVVVAGLSHPGRDHTSVRLAPLHQ
jgi:hypothetical protein